jgi:GntR family transcriptional regulator
MGALPDSSLPVPLYRQVFGILRQRIVDSVYAAGDQLLTEDGLAAEFGVSRATIRQAVGELVKQGLVDRKQGRGTFVLPGAGHLLGQRFRGSLADLISETERAKVRHVEVSHGSTLQKRIAEALKLDDPVATVVRRTRTIDGKTFAYTVNYLPRPYSQLVSVKELRKVGLMTLLESKGVKFASAHQSIRAELADLEVCSRLNMDFGEAVLFAERLLFDSEQRPIQFVQTWYRGDLYEYSVMLGFVGEGGDLRTQLA